MTDHNHSDAANEPVFPPEELNNTQLWSFGTSESDALDRMWEAIPDKDAFEEAGEDINTTLAVLFEQMIGFVSRVGEELKNTDQWEYAEEARNMLRQNDTPEPTGDTGDEAVPVQLALDLEGLVD